MDTHVRSSLYILRGGDITRLTPPPPTPFNWTAIPLRSWRSRVFSEIIPNRRGSVDSHMIWGLEASSTLPLYFYYASVTLLLRSHYDNEDLATLSLRWWRCSCDLATTLAMELRFHCAFVSFLYRIWNSDTLLLRPGRFYCASTTLLPFLLRFVSFWPNFRIVAESPSRGMGVNNVMTIMLCRNAKASQRPDIMRVLGRKEPLKSSRHSLGQNFFISWFTNPPTVNFRKVRKK